MDFTLNINAKSHTVRSRPTINITIVEVIVNGNNGKNNATAVGLCAVVVVSWWRNKGLRTLNRMHNEVRGCPEIWLGSKLKEFVYECIRLSIPKSSWLYVVMLRLEELQRMFI